MLYKGQARIVVSTKDLVARGVLAPHIAQECTGHLVLGYLKVGDTFGE